MQKTIFERSCKNLRKFEKYQKFVEKRKNGRGVRFFVGNSRCRGCFRPFLCNCMCFTCKPRVLWAFSFYVRCCLVLQKFALATSKTVLQVVRIQSLENYGKTSFSRMIQVSNCNKRVQKKQPNVRLFGEFHFHLFRSHCLKSHVFRATRSGDSADFVLHAFDRPHFSRSGRFCPVFSVSGVGNRSVQFGCRCGNVPYGRANRLRSHQITQTFCVAFSCVFLHVAYCRVDVTPFRRVQHLTIFYLERGRLTRGISCERVYTL